MTAMKSQWFTLVLLGCLGSTGCDKNGSPPPSITRSIPGGWRTGKVPYQQAERTIYYLPQARSEDYSKISTPGDPNSPDPLVVLQGAVFHWKSAQAEQVKGYFVADDPIQRVDSARLANILGRATGREDWRMTHLVCMGEMLIVRGTFFNTAKGTREIDLWPFSQVEGKWKLHLLSGKVKGVDWLMKLLYQDAVAFSP
jgi:hypothetical protein